MPFNYYDIEDAIVTRLTTALAGVAVVVPLFDNESEAQTAIDTMEQQDNPLITVAYNGSSFDGSNTTNPQAQEDNMSFICAIEFNKLRGDNGIHNTIRLIKNSLVGYQPGGGATRLQLKSIEFVDRNVETANFSYNVTFTCSKKQVQAFVDGDDDISGAANLVNLQYDDKSITATV